MRFELMISSEEDGFRWVSSDIEKDFGLDGIDSERRIGDAVLLKVEDSRRRAAIPKPPPKPPTERDLARIAAKGHDCFAEENEVVHQSGDSIWTSCRLCGDVISAG